MTTLLRIFFPDTLAAKDPIMPTTLPTFRDLAAHAVALHLSACPTDGYALVMRDLVSATPIADDAAIVLSIQMALVSLDGAVSALGVLHGHEPARALSAACCEARSACHAAFMAAHGVDVSTEKAA